MIHETGHITYTHTHTHPCTYTCVCVCLLTFLVLVTFSGFQCVCLFPASCVMIPRSSQTWDTSLLALLFHLVWCLNVWLLYLILLVTASPNKISNNLSSNKVRDNQENDEPCPSGISRESKSWSWPWTVEVCVGRPWRHVCILYLGITGNRCEPKDTLLYTRD